jgi:hypothetical protein
METEKDESLANHLDIDLKHDKILVKYTSYAQYTLWQHNRNTGFHPDAYTGL